MSDRLLASLPVGIVYQNAAGEILAANPAAERILGLSTSQLRGITSIDPRWQAVRADGSPFPGAEHPAMAALRSGQAVRDVRFGVFNPALGKTTWINVSAFPIRGDGADAVTGVYALFEDISGFRQQQDQLRLQGLVLDQIEDRVTVTDLDGMVVYVNQTEARALGFAREDLVGKHVSVFGESPEADATQQEIVDQTMTKGSWQGKVVNNAANGSRHILNLRTALVRDEAGKPVALAGIGTDITEQDRAERIERQYQSVIQASIDGFWIVDAAARILDANDAMCRMLGYTREELLGMSIPDIEADESAADTAAHIREMMTIGHVQFEARHKRKDGTVIDVEVSALYVASQGDRFFTFVRDITERKQMDQQLRIAATAFETQEGMLISDRDNVVLRVNQAFTDITGYSAGDVVGKTPSLLRSGRHDAAFYERMWQS
ncbi:MAG: PAS domain S-box protein, partial [Proteobacteria bacterium]|nr:PAS domain S-box protein [Pseudomonadota bacterium]